MDLSNMSALELRNLQEKIQKEMKKREQQDLVKAREQILAIAQSVGMPLKDLIGAGIRAKSGTVAVRFRHPDVDLSVGLGATAVLVVSGLLAGLFPALRAARVNPIAALRVE